MFMKKILLMLVAALSAAALSASEPKMAAGKVVDAYSRELMTEFQADLLRPDSTLIKSYFAQSGMMSFNQPMNLRVDSLPDSDCILHVTAEGYLPAYMNIKRLGRRESMVELRPVMMTRIPFYKHKELNEVTVTASKVKMVMKGDTIVYNADAFALAKGSMLDGLIDQLPGVELKSSGQIYVNGKFVSELLVNGENFFKGDPRIALENLPAYMVKDVKVFHKDDPMDSDPMKRLDEKPMVMDVGLKKQYQTGWIANAEGGYGTAGRWLGRLFALMFTRDSRLSVFGNVNNTNDDRKPGQTDNWNPDWQSAGRATVATGGVDWLWNSRLRQWKVETNLTARHKKSDLQTSTVSERYLSGGNLHATGRSAYESRELRLSTDNKVSFHIPRLWLELIPKASFERVKADASIGSTTSDAIGQLLNSLDESTRSYSRTWTVGGELNGTWRLPQIADNLNFKASADWRDRRHESLTRRNLTFQQQADMNELTKPFELTPERGLRAKAEASYGTSYHASRIFHGNVHVRYTYLHDQRETSRDYYRMELLGDGTVDDNMTLPSVSDAMRRHAFVAANSFDSRLRDDSHTLSLSLTNWFPHMLGAKPGVREYDKYQPNIKLGADIKYIDGHIDYHKEGLLYPATRRGWFVEPKVEFNVSDIGAITYTYKLLPADLTSMVDVTDDADPLYIYKGNTHLKDARIHELWLMLWKLFPKGPSLEATWRRYENLTAQSAAYDLTTGITTYRPVNVQGNWDLEARLNYGKRFRGEQWRLESDTRVYYQNSVDLLGEQLSTVRNLNLGENLRLTYRIADGLELAARGNAEWRRATSPMADFNTINAVDVDYGLILRATRLPWDMSFTTDLMMHTRRGYADSRLNDDRLVWNARLAKSILRGNLTFAIDGFDILGQLSNTRLTMNSQGRTETRYNTLPRYAMLHVIYRLNLQPKKQ